MKQQLQQLLELACGILDQAIEHPQYEELTQRGFDPGETSVFEAQRVINLLHLKITKFSASMDNQIFSNVLVKTKNQSIKNIAGYIIDECEKHDINLASLISGFAQAAAERGFSVVTIKLLEDASKECQEG
jgi:hypothetical protein